MREHVDYIVGLLRHLGVHDADVDDVTMSMFYKVWSKIETYDPDRPPRPWLSAYAVRFASDYRGLARHRRERPLDDNVVLTGSLESSIEARDTLRARLDAIGNPGAREVFVLHYIAGFTLAEVAKMLDRPEGTVAAQVSRAMTKFREEEPPCR